MKKGNSAVIGVVIVIVLVVAGFLIFHKSNKPAVNGSSSNVAAINNSIVKTKTSSSLGQYFVATSSGMPLYTYGGDSSGTSNVSGALLASWPAYIDTGTTTGLPTGFSTIMRSNGQSQYTYQGLPLYTFVSDSSSTVTGNGVSNFNIAKPVATTSSTSSTQSTTNTTAPPTSNSTNNTPTGY